MRSALIGLSIFASGSLWAQQYVISTYAGGSARYRRRFQR